MTLKVKTYIKQISCDANPSVNPLTQHYNTSRRGRGMVVPNCAHGNHDSTHLGDGKCLYLVLIDYLWYKASVGYRQTGGGYFSTYKFCIFFKLKSMAEDTTYYHTTVLSIYLCIYLSIFSFFDK